MFWLRNKKLISISHSSGGIMYGLILSAKDCSPRGESLCYVLEQDTVSIQSRKTCPNMTEKLLTET